MLSIKESTSILGLSDIELIENFIKFLFSIKDLNDTSLLLQEINILNIQNTKHWFLILVFIN